MFLQELKSFSKKNWWVYIMLVIILGLVGYTGRGNLLEILLMFVANFLANLFVMIAMSNYSRRMNKLGSMYHLSSTLLFVGIGLYGFIFLEQSQYIIWQIAFIFAAIKAYSFYNFSKEIKIFNEWSFAVLNIFLFGVFLHFFNVELFSILQVLGFSLVTIGLVSIRDNFRYFMNLGGTFFIIIGSFVGTYNSYIAGSLDGISLGYLLLTATVCIYFLQLLPSYLSKIKK